MILLTDKSKISSNQKRFFIALSLYPLSFFANTPFKFNIFISIQFSFLEMDNFDFNRRYKHGTNQNQLFVNDPDCSKHQFSKPIQ